MKSHGLRPVKNCRANLNGCLEGEGGLGLVLITRNEDGGRGRGGQGMRALDFLETLMRYVNQGVVGRDVVEIFEMVLNFSSLKDIRCRV